MVEPFLGEVRVFAFDYAPKGWAACDGAVQAISQNQALFALLGTSFGGDGRTTFGLPDLRGRVGVHTDGGGFFIGNKGGEAAHTLVAAEMPAPHTHVAQGTSAQATANVATGLVLANVPTANAYAKPNPPQPIGAGTVSSIGGAAHENMSPYLAVNFCIALTGIFPPRP